MKKVIFVLLLMGITINIFSQISAGYGEEKKSCITVGILQGGGSLVGADFEALVSNKVGFQIGAGLVGFGAGMNFHFKPTVRSSFISLQYWHQGFGTGYAQSLLGPSFVYRAPRWFTAQIGLGYVLGYGPAWTSSVAKSPVILMYSIGAYFPI